MSRWDNSHYPIGITNRYLRYPGTIHWRYKVKQRADGRYATRIKTGIDPDGKTIYKYLCANSEKELDAKIEDHVRQSESEYVDPDKTTVTQWMEHWLTIVKKDSVRQNTWEFYRCIIDALINPSIGTKTLSKLAPRDIRSLYAKLRSTGLSSGRIHQTHVTINSAMKVAVEDGILTKNPCNNSTVKEKAKKPDVKQERFVFSQDHIDTLLKSLNGWWKAFVFLAWSTGMRREELLGLRWMDIDLKKGLVSVVKAVTVSQEEGIVSGKLKNDSSYRTITINKQCCAELLKHQATQKESRRVVGIMQYNKDIIFSVDGELADPRLISKQFKKLALAAGLPKESHLHAIRHTHATQLLRAGIHPKKVQYRLGHATYQMTMDTYSHVTPEMQEDIIEVLNELMTKK